MIEYVNRPPRKPGDAAFSEYGRDAIERETKRSQSGDDVLRGRHNLHAYGEAICYQLLSDFGEYDKETFADVYIPLVREATDITDIPSHEFHSGFDWGLRRKTFGKAQDE
jgi:hypothetical protein